MAERRPLVVVSNEVVELPLGDTLPGGGNTGVRRKRLFYTSSDASVAVPSWAQGGTGTVYITGVGGGASGGCYRIGTARGPGGAAGAFAIRHPIRIPAGVTTISVVVGSGGAARVSSGSGSAFGNSGTYSEVTVGSSSLRLSGGSGITASAASAGPGPVSPVLVNGQAFLPETFINGQFTAPSWGASIPLPSEVAFGITLFHGWHGGTGDSVEGGFGAGAWSPFGAGGPGVSAVTSVTNGGAAVGYGAGGAGAGGAAGSGTVLTSGAGAPGFIELEFEEWPND